MAVALGVVLAIVGGHRTSTGRILGGGSAGTVGGGSARVGLPFSPIPPGLPGEPEGLRYGGVVVDGAGVAVADAIVTAEPEGDPAGVAPAPGAAVAAVSRSTPTPVDGRFAITGLAPGRYRIRVTGTGLVATQLRFVAVPADETPDPADEE